MMFHGVHAAVAAISDAQGASCVWGGRGSLPSRRVLSTRMKIVMLKLVGSAGASPSQVTYF